MDNNVSYQDEKIKFEDIIKENIPLNHYTTLKTGGNARYFSNPGTFYELIALLRFAKEKGLEITVIGGGSNLLVSDSGVDGLVIRTHHLSRFSTKGNMFSCRAGMSLDRAITITIEDGMLGLEGLGGIPGTVGGAIVGNSGAYGHLISDKLLYVDYITYDGKTHRISRTDIDFSYRYSSFLDMRNFIIFEVGFLLRNTNNSIEARQARERAKKDRRDKGLFEFPSAGSVFKNPDNCQYTAGELIDRCGLKGKTYGGAMICKTHANYIMNFNKATSSDIYYLSQICKEEVMKKFNIELKYEIKVLGNFKN